MGPAKALTDDGLFIGQPPVFFELLRFGAGGRRSGP